MPVIIDCLNVFLKGRGTVNDVINQLKQLVHDTLGEIDAYVTVSLLKILIESGNIPDVWLGRFRLSHLIQLIEFSLLLGIFFDSFLNGIHLSLNVTLTLVIVKGSHSTQVKERQLGDGLGIGDQLPFFKEHAWLV